ncbi:MAG: DNA-directed RNA polymerase subunit P [Hadesarchaea archaeon]|nr:DNA-directed RNA polymerase subunit P [Hadesarchaea archaeon]
MYKCGGCNRIIDDPDPATSRCPFCGSRILFKIRPKVVRKVKAR